MSLLTGFLAPMACALALSSAIEAWGGAARAPFGRRPGDIVLRLGAYALLTLFWFSFSWRPWLAASSTVTTVAALVLISRAKRAVIGEPLVFSDFALLPQVPRHPQLYYIPPVTSPRVAGPALVAVAGVGLWYWLEPSLLPASLWLSLAAILALPLALLALAAAAARGPLARALAQRFPRPDLDSDIARIGLPATLMAYALRRRAEPARAAMPAGAAAPGDPVVIVIQLESFIDPERLGGPPLPALELIRSRAAEYGRLRVPAHGAYTMRSEHAVLTGSEPSDLGFGVYDPYLANGGEEPESLPRRAAANGYETLFVHPFHRDFFQRARVMQRFGFRRLVMGEDFADAQRVGPYVSDVALGRRILAEVRARRGPLFLFSVTMENHGPWKPGRLPGVDDPLAQYLHHVANTGRMVEELVAGLADERATLCVFGDHAPALPTCRPGFGETSTDYALFRFGGPASEPRRIDRTADALGRHLRATLHTDPTPPSASSPAQA
ncbi:LTA synthase family protein [Methylobacterium radiodurans]|uniref:Sulfatase n=1 Tax=Methylobacterium radiodurans TaxID=2202828 RepID=A0A2U8VY97_9HYPH|nr:LTA synthase family protein [Methylobacterium radiodurans]AWN38438.1 sulfatase [Methylobacterium radiodurans]